MSRELGRCFFKYATSCDICRVQESQLFKYFIFFFNLRKTIRKTTGTYKAVSFPDGINCTQYIKKN